MPQEDSLFISGRLYRLTQKIGSGTFGQVYLARDEKDRPFAVKTLRILPTPSQVAAFKNEFLLLTKLKHPFLCVAHDFVYSEPLKSYLILSDYAPGRTFFEATENLDPGEIERLSQQVLEVLDYVHRHGIIHFDIKCPNLIVQEDQTVRLLDFGFAHLLSEPLTKFPGSLRYAAPEILLRSPSTDHRTDLYSFGMVLFRALTRRFPFKENEPADMVDWHLHHELSWTAEEKTKFPEYLRNLVEALLKKAPAERLSRAQSGINWIHLHASHRAPPLGEPTPDLLPSEGPLVARETELTAAVSSLEQPSGQSFLFLGETGIGKTRLLKEIKYAAEVKEYRCCWFDNFLERDGLTQIQQQLRLPPFQSPDEFFQLSFGDIEKMGPAIFFVDDLQQADPLFGEWLLQLQDRRLAASLFVGWEGTIPAQGPLVSLFQKGRLLPLAPFSRDQIKEFLSKILSDAKTASKWLDPLCEFSSGNPFLVTEGIRFLLQDSRQRHLPNSITNLYDNTLATLSETSRRILETLSLSKRPATLQEISQMVSLKSTEVAAQLPPLIASGWVGRQVTFQPLETRYRIANAALILALQQRQDDKTRRERYAKLLEIASLRENPDLEELAAYAFFAKDTQKGPDYLNQLAQHYESLFLTQKAVQTYQNLLLLLSDQPDEAAKVRRQLIPLLVLAGHPDEALDLFPSDRPLTLPERKLKGWVLTRRGKFSEAETLYQQGLTESDEGDPLRQELLNDLGNVYLQTGQIERALHLFRQTLPPPSWTDEEKCRASKNNNLGLALALSGNTQEALSFEAERLALFKRQRDEHQIASILGQMGFIHLTADRFTEAALAFEEALSLSEKLGDLHNIFVLLDNLMLICQKRGFYPEAIRYFSKAVSYRNLLPFSYQTVQNFLKGAFLYLTIGLVEPAHSCLEKIASLVDEATSRPLRGWIALAWGYYFREKRSPEASVSHLEEAIGIGDEEKDQGLLLWGHYALADFWLEQGETEKAREITARISGKCQGLRDEELRLRLNLLAIRLGPRNPSEEDTLRRLGQECDEKGMRELAAEAFTAAGDPRGRKIYHEIASRLPEEYRMAYQRTRLGR